MTRSKTRKAKPNKQAGTSAPHHDKDPDPQEINTLVGLFAARKYPEAATLAKTLTIRFPLHFFGWKVLGAAFKQMGLSAEALAPMQKAVALSSSDAEAHNNLGATFKDLGRLDEAEASHRRALDINPEYAEAHNNLGSALRDLGRLDEAKTSCRRALEIKPEYAEAHNNLGSTFQDLGRPVDAEASYRRALEIKPDLVETFNNLALLLNVAGKSVMALRTIHRSLQIRETIEAKSIFVDCVKRSRLTQGDSEIQATIVRALVEPWDRPGELVAVCTNLVKLAPEIAGSIARAANVWPQQLSARELYGPYDLITIAANPLLCALLNAAPISDIEMERFLTMARCAMLEMASAMENSAAVAGPILAFHSALARQCFINEYVFSHTNDEIRKAGELRDSLIAALETKTQIPALLPVAVAAYFPLCSLPHAARLLDTQWPDDVMALLVQQISEPSEELHLSASIPRLTEIEDEVSLLVQDQYEENPYPRWIKLAFAKKPETIDVALRRKFPLATCQLLGKSDSLDILIAGCGTGQHPIETARRFRGAHVLAVDLSRASLCYAKRKTREMGLTSIEYAQGDLMQLGSLGRSFDLIESGGVLHHLADPVAGWRVLLSLLRPRGVMRLGLYSEVARRNIVRIRNFIAEKGYGSTPNEIRRCRQDLMVLNKSRDFGSTCESSDFFSISTCRDLLFHVQEHRMTLTAIDAFLRENNLAFLGFDIDQQVIRAYKLRFPEDHAAINLAQWQIFESENPDTFLGMYQFFIQKLNDVSDSGVAT